MDTVLVIVIQFYHWVVFGAMAMFLTKGMMAARQATLAKKSSQYLRRKLKPKEYLPRAKKEADREKTLTEGEIRERRSEIQRQENRLAQKEATLERKLEEAERREQSLEDKNRQSEEIKTEIEKIKQDQLTHLEQVSQMSSAEAKAELFDEWKGNASRAARRLHHGRQDKAGTDEKSA